MSGRGVRGRLRERQGARGSRQPDAGRACGHAVEGEHDRGAFARMARRALGDCEVVVGLAVPVVDPGRRALDPVDGGADGVPRNAGDASEPGRGCRDGRRRLRARSGGRGGSCGRYGRRGGRRRRRRRVGSGGERRDATLWLGASCADEAVPNPGVNRGRLIPDERPARAGPGACRDDRDRGALLDPAVDAGVVAASAAVAEALACGPGDLEGEVVGRGVEGGRSRVCRPGDRRPWRRRGRDRRRPGRGSAAPRARRRASRWRGPRCRRGLDRRRSLAPARPDRRPRSCRARRGPRIRRSKRAEPSWAPSRQGSSTKKREF